jgi:hypothetical protein
MKFFHVSDKGIIGSSRTAGFLNTKRFISPFVLSCIAGEDAFIGSVLGARYADERLQAIRPELGSICNKMATEGIFECIRCVQFSTKTPRYESNYMFACVKDAGKFIEEFQQGKTIYEVEMDDTAVERYDMNLFTAANKAVTKIYDKENKRFDQAKAFAIQYWQGASSEAPVFEYLTKEPIILRKEVILWT